MSDKKMLLIFPPQWTPISPYFALPSLIGQLKSKGYSAKALDLNIDFFNELLLKENIKEALLKVGRDFEDLKKEIASIFSPSKTSINYSFEEQIKIYRYSKF